MKRARILGRLLALCLCLLMVPLPSFAADLLSYAAVVAEYESGEALFAQGDLAGAREAFEACQLYGDSQAYVQYIDAVKALQSSQLSSAYPALAVLAKAGFLDADSLLLYVLARNAENGENSAAAMQLYVAAGILDSSERLAGLLSSGAMSTVPPLDAAEGSNAIVLPEMVQARYLPDGDLASIYTQLALVQVEKLVTAENGILWAAVSVGTDGPIEPAEAPVVYVPADTLYFMRADEVAPYMEKLAQYENREPGETYAWITGQKVNVRREMWPKAYSLAKLSRGEAVLVLSNQVGDDGKEWYTIRRSDGVEGHVPGQYVDTMTYEEQLDYLASVGQMPAPTARPPVPSFPLETSPAQVVEHVAPSVNPTSIPFTVPARTEDQYDLALYLLQTGSDSSLLRAMTMFDILSGELNASAYAEYAQCLFLLEQSDFEEAEKVLSTYTGSRSLSPFALPDRAEMMDYYEARKLEFEGRFTEAIDLYATLNVYDSTSRAVWLQGQLPSQDLTDTLAMLKAAKYAPVFEAIVGPEPAPAEEVSISFAEEPVVEEAVEAPVIRYAYRLNEMTPGDPYYTWEPVEGASIYHVVACWMTTAVDDVETDPKQTEGYQAYKAMLNAVATAEDPVAALYTAIAASDETEWFTTGETEIDMAEILETIAVSAEGISQGRPYATSYYVYVLYE